MQTQTINGLSETTLAFRNNLGEPRWYALYTCPNHEKKISEGLATRSIERFLPLYETVRRRGERKVRVQVPLFAGYVFVHIDIRDRLDVLQVPGVVRLVGFNGVPVAIPNAEVDSLQRGLASGLIVEPCPYLRIGNPVRVNSGPLCGLTGKLLRRKQNYRIVISIDSIMRSIIAEVSLADVDVAETLKGARSTVMPAVSPYIAAESSGKLSP